MKALHYYKRRWEECTGEEETESWGFSMYYFETVVGALRPTTDFIGGLLLYCFSYYHFIV